MYCLCVQTVHCNIKQRVIKASSGRLLLPAVVYFITLVPTSSSIQPEDRTELSEHSLTPLLRYRNSINKIQWPAILQKLHNGVS
jgi:hypothetical protein